MAIDTMGHGRATLSEMFDKAPPNAPEAEYALLGSMILDQKVIGEVLEVVPRGSWMFQPKNSAVFNAVVNIDRSGVPVDLVQVKQFMQDNGSLKGRAGVEHLIELVESVPSSVSAVHYAEIVREKYILRKAIDISGRVLKRSYDHDESDAVLDEAQGAMYELANMGRGKGDSAKGMSELLQSLYDLLASGHSLDDVVPTGFRGLDDILAGGGVRPGQVVVVAARPGFGKTSLSLNIAENMAIAGTPVLYFSIEMGGEEVARRTLARLTGMGSDWMDRQLTGDDFAEVAVRIGGFNGEKLVVDDQGVLTTDTVRNRVRRQVSERGVRVVFIDYLQLMTGGRRSETQNVMFEQMMRELKLVAKDLGVAVVLMSQLNRGVEGRENQRPRLSDLRSSGSIEQDADVVMMIYREDKTKESAPGWQPNGKADIIVAKQRNGRTGVVKMMYDSVLTSFRDDV